MKTRTQTAFFTGAMALLALTPPALADTAPTQAETVETVREEGPAGRAKKAYERCMRIGGVLIFGPTVDVLTIRESALPSPLRALYLILRKKCNNMNSVASANEMPNEAVAPPAPAIAPDAPGRRNVTVAPPARKPVGKARPSVTPPVGIRASGDPRKARALPRKDPRKAIGPKQDDPRKSIGPKQDDPRKSIGPKQDDPRKSIGPKQDDPRKSIGPKQDDPRTSEAGGTGTVVGSGGPTFDPIGPQAIGPKQDDPLTENVGGNKKFGEGTRPNIDPIGPKAVGPKQDDPRVP